MSGELCEYEATVSHEDLEGPLVMELKAMTERGATARARLAAMHMYRHAPLLKADVTLRKLS